MVSMVSEVNGNENTDHKSLEHQECEYNFKVNYPFKSFNRQFMGKTGNLWDFHWSLELNHV